MNTKAEIQRLRERVLAIKEEKENEIIEISFKFKEGIEIAYSYQTKEFDIEIPDEQYEGLTDDDKEKLTAKLLESILKFTSRAKGKHKKRVQKSSKTGDQ